MACTQAVERLVSDMKMIVAYETAADWREQKAMDSAFNAVSWDDQCVKTALPEYLGSSGPDRAKVDRAFHAMMPKPAESTDPQQAMMHTWIKARLFSYNKASPFE